MKAFYPLVAVSLLAACSSSPHSLFERAQKEYATHQYKAAQLDLANALAADPANAAYLELHARNSLAQGDGVAAKVALGKLPAGHRPADFALLVGEAALLREQPGEARTAVSGLTSAEAERVRAMAALQDDNGAAATAAFTKGLGAAGGKVRLLADFARFKLHQGDTAGASDLAGQALREDGQSLDALLVSAQIATARGDLARALETYDAVEKAYPANLTALTGKAAILGDLGRVKEMRETLARASSGAVGDPTLIYLQARAAAARRDWTAARDVLQANETRLAGREDAALLHAQVLAELGQPEQARSRIAPLLFEHPDDLAARRLMARIQLKAGDARGAVETLRPLAAKPATEAADLRLLADAAAKAGDPDAAQFAQRARFPTPQSLARALADADTAMKAGNWGNAIKLYESILAVTDGKNALVLNNMAFAQGQVGNKQVALDYALRALKYAPDNASVMDTAGWLLAETGSDRARSLDLLRRAAQIAPANATIRDHLRRVEAG